jgi:hypothetical protein
MRLKEIVTELKLDVLSENADLDREARGGYTSDLLSDVMGRAREKELWITLQTHQNIVAVAKLKEIAGIVLVGGRRPDPETLVKADHENIPIFLSDEPAYIVSGKLFRLFERSGESG